MGDDRYPGRTDDRDDTYSRPESIDYGSGRPYSYSSAREYQAAGRLGGGRGDGGRNRDWDGDRSWGDRSGGDRDWGGRSWGERGAATRDWGDRGWGARDYGYDRYGERERTGGRSFDRDRQQFGGGNSEYHGSYAHDGRRFADVGRYRDADSDERRGGYDRGRYERERGYGRQSYQQDDDDRGFFQRASDEVRSWFGDEEAERRRDRDVRMDEQRYGSGPAHHHHDHDYHNWRRGQMDAFDRDYQEYREENRQKFESDFSAWRTARQTQRDSLSRVQEHQDVVGSDGQHVGTVDKVRGDRIILTKSDADAGGRHHSIPSRWIQSVDANQVTLSKTAQEAKDHWRDEERNSAMFGDSQNQSQNGERNENRDERQGGDDDRSRTNLNRSFSGTY